MSLSIRLNLRMLSLSRRVTVVCRSVHPSNEDAYKLLHDAVVQAKYVCDLHDVDEIECVIAWDTVDEIRHGIDRRENLDPLEAYCVENEDTDECRIYDI